MGYLILWMMQHWKFEIGLCFLLFALVPVVSCSTTFFLIPSPSNFSERSSAVTGSKCENYVNPARLIIDSFKILNKNRQQNFCFLIALLFSFVYIVTYNTQIVTSEADVMKAVFFSRLPIGLFFTPLLSLVLDKIRTTIFFIFLIVLLSLSVIMLALPKGIITEVLSGISIELFLSCLMVFVVKWFISYAPPFLLGTCSGLYVMTAGIFSMLVSLAFDLIPERRTMNWAFFSVGVLAVCSSLSFVLYILGYHGRLPGHPPSL
eukprot:TRINITY_DN9100_c0_g1_i3.p1 TRINITY_DN9100_c0_g1~~TRINITY_DN9100_c0_g1_i3.p1  ORF type:complete len:262 (-),score=21.49 TRINITY_DN9100_c0_g1_i3:179-964(-)